MSESANRYKLDQHDRGPRPPLWICRDTQQGVSGSEAFTRRADAEDAVRERNAAYDRVLGLS